MNSPITLKERARNGAPARSLFPDPEAHKRDELLDVALADLTFGIYNRLVSQFHVASIAAAYRERPAAMPAIEVNWRDDGRLVVINGQHRTQAARLLGWSTIPALVHFGWTEQEEARAHRDSAWAKIPNSLDRWWTARCAGQEDVLAVEEIVERLGLAIPRYFTSKCAPTDIQCPDALLKIAYGTGLSKRTPTQPFRPERVETVLSFVLTTWDSNEYRFQNQLLVALDQFLRRYADAPGFSVPEASKKLGNWPLLEIIRRGRSLQQGAGLKSVPSLVQALVTLYDRGRRVGRLVPNEEDV